VIVLIVLSVYIKKKMIAKPFAFTCKMR